MAPMTKIHRKALDLALKELCQDLEVDEVCIHLISCLILSDEDREKLEAIPVRTAKVRELVQILKTKGDAAWQAFLEGLDESQDFLADALRTQERQARDIPEDENEVANIIEAGKIVDANKLVTDQDLNKIADGLGPEWKKVGKVLGLKQNKIFQCEADNQLSVHDKIFDMLHKWKKQERKGATRLAIVNALAKIGEVDPDAYDFLLLRD